MEKLKTLSPEEIKQLKEEGLLPEEEPEEEGEQELEENADSQNPENGREPEGSEQGEGQ